ncbi:PotD/PotF family extracellular solute-binding protein [Shewanella sp. VB17]|uniref:ABC transporter substrate-binding protein n=1 Tax=Shewanella sp. VB17 TaxID=2739432 RepID=UPI001C257AB4|nr:PotD/PotF family extracellular solute-binding protein [Shewanella sp. VB17]
MDILTLNIGFLLSVSLLMSVGLIAGERINVLTWEGYVEPYEVQEVNDILKERGYEYEIYVIPEWAEGPEQMFNILRAGKADISFLTLNYIKMQKGKTAQLLQGIDINSPRLSNYQYLDPLMLNVSMGVENEKTLYLPWGGGAYGFWADMSQLNQSDLPRSLNDLLKPRWQNRLSLTKGQIQPNIAIASLMLGKKAFFLNDLSRKELVKEQANGELQSKLNALYNQVGYYWTSGPDFENKNLHIVASYGIGAFAANRSGGHWQLINFEEGNTVWMDTINFHKDLTGRKLEAAEIFTNYFIGDKVQKRLVNDLGMISASLKYQSASDQGFFVQDMFWPPYQRTADNIMFIMSKNAMDQTKQ